MESDQKILIESPQNWGHCPLELLCLIFKNLDSVTLVKCMYICRSWNDAALYTAQKRRLWEEIVDIFTVENSKMIRMKSLDLTSRDLFENTMRWLHSDKAELLLHKAYNIKATNHLHVYRTKLIMVTLNSVKFFDIVREKFVRNIKLKCIDFMENDNMILIVTARTGELKTLNLYAKGYPNDFNMLESNKKIIEKVVKFRLDKEGCFLIDDQSQLVLYESKDLNWNVQYLARYYGNAKTVRCLHIFKEELYILLKWCQLFCANKQSGFEGPVTVLISSDEEEIVNIYVKMFHKFGFIYAVHLSEFRFIRKTVDGNNIFVVQCPDLTCATEHGEILLLGYSDGKIELFMPREKDEKAALIRTFHICEATGYSLDDTRIKSIDAFDETEQHNVFVATQSHVFHLILKHTDIDNYLWSVFPQRMCV